MTSRWNEDAEPTTPTTTRKVTAMRFYPSEPGTLFVTLATHKPVPYAEPDELQDGVIEPTAVFKRLE